jgi:preprotein translocase subunit SecA
MANVISKLFGDKHQRMIKPILPVMEEISRLEQQMISLSDHEIQSKTAEFKQRLENGETVVDILPEAFAVVKNVCRRLLGKSWDVMGHKTTWDMVPFDVQLIGAVVLHQGKIAEMATGEGKTLVASLPLYLNALEGKGAHLVTVNDYLAQRDSQWMGKIYEFLGLSVGCIVSDQPPPVRREQYACDITYGTNNEFGFDYLRDNMAIHPEDMVQRGHHYAIVDEVDSVLIDEARTPLIISGPVSVSTHRYHEMKPGVEKLVRRQRDLVNHIVAEAENLLQTKLTDDEYQAGIRILQAYRGAPKHRRLVKLLGETGVKRLMGRVENDFLREKRMQEIDEELYYAIDEKSYVIDLTEKGREELAKIHGGDAEMFVLPDLAVETQQIYSDQSLPDNIKTKKEQQLQELYAERSERIHNIAQLLRAFSLYEKDVEYVLQDGKVVIVDEFTGRLQVGRRYSDGLHQAIEAKEGVRIEGETQTIATITLQNYFRLYNKLAGMTGTAETEEQEFFDIYKLEVVVIPTNEPIRRADFQDEVYRTKREKYNAIIEEVERLHQERLPVLVGTVSVEVSETLSRMLKRRGIAHNVLNAKHHQREAEIVTQAGQPGAVTIATNMAGRGTDIKLGAGVIRFPENYIEQLISEIETKCSGRKTGCVVTELPSNLENTISATLESKGITATPVHDSKQKAEFKSSGHRPGPNEVLLIPKEIADPRDIPWDGAEWIKARDYAEGGLHIIGTERHESRRIDRQLRGRSGRQGDPGASKFYLSLEDDLMRLFGSERIAGVMDRLGVKEGDVITHSMITKSIERAQKRVETHNFGIRKHLLEYDDVMNQQREIIYDRRRVALLEDDPSEETKDMIAEFLDDVLAEYVDPSMHAEDWDWDELRQILMKTFLLNLPVGPAELSPATEEQLRQIIDHKVEELFQLRKETLGEEMFLQLQKLAILRVMDEKWKDHLYEMDRLKEGVGLRAYGQKDPLIEYKREGFETFQNMLRDINEEALRYVFRAQVQVDRPRRPEADQSRMSYSHRSSAGMAYQQPAAGESGAQPPAQSPTRAGKPQPVRTGPKIGRNDPCPCGSGKKYKNCCGR